MEIKQEHIDKINELLSYGLVQGLGNPVPGKMCVEAVICNALGLEHSDDPKCVMESLRTIKIGLNDIKYWSSNQARAKGLKRLAVAQLGSLGMDEKEFVSRVARFSIQHCVPLALRTAAKVLTGEHQSKLIDAALKCEQDPSKENVIAAYEASKAAFNVYKNFYNTGDFARNAAYNNTVHTLWGASYTVQCVYDATWNVYNTYNSARAAYYACYTIAHATQSDDIDKFLFDYAEGIVQILIYMKAPGCVWL